MTTLIAGLVLGVAGGAHCTAMCGPLIAITSPRGWKAVMHHTGRWLTYAALGFVAGAAGAGASAAGFGRWTSWTAAAAMVILALVPSAVPAGRQRSRSVQAIVGLVLRSRRRLRTHPRAGALVFGLLNGLLPCGLTYAATLAAIGTGSIWAGEVFMTGFALGTTAILATAGAFWSKIVDHVPMRARRLAPLGFAAVALMLVWRGWSAGAATHLH